MRMQGNQDGSEVNGAHQLLVYVGGVNLLGKNINTAVKGNVVIRR
jgi:hypothetical protein